MTALQSRLFTPTFTQRDRESLYRALGSFAGNFFYAETTPETVLTARLMEGSRATGLLTPRTLNELKDSTRTPTMVVARSKTLTLSPLRGMASDLWSELLPHPLHQLSSFFSGKATEAKLHIEPAAWEESLKAVWEQFRALENRLSATELGILRVRRGTERFALLLHHVRRKRIRMGTSDGLDEMCAKWDEGQLSREQLRVIFGTATDLVYLNLNTDTDPLSELTECLKKAVAFQSLDYPATSEESPPQGEQEEQHEQ